MAESTMKKMNTTISKDILTSFIENQEFDDTYGRMAMDNIVSSNSVKGSRNNNQKIWSTNIDVSRK
jgi:hypothetical protein